MKQILENNLPKKKIIYFNGKQHPDKKIYFLSKSFNFDLTAPSQTKIRFPQTFGLAFVARRKTPDTKPERLGRIEGCVSR